MVSSNVPPGTYALVGALPRNTLVVDVAELAPEAREGRLHAVDTVEVASVFEQADLAPLAPRALEGCIERRQRNPTEREHDRA
jgi:hypothetical protein